MGKLRRFLALSSAEKRILARAWLSLPVVDLVGRFSSVPRTQSWLAGDGAWTREERSHAPESLARLVDQASRHHLLPIRCLTRSIYLQHLLARHGFEADLCFGVSREGAGLNAHAWVELEGRPLGEPPELQSRFASLDSAS